MVAKPVRIKQSDVTRILKGAKAAGVELAVVIREGEVLFVPTSKIAKSTWLEAFADDEPPKGYL